MNVELPPNLARFVTDLVEAGDFNSADDVVREGLRLLEQQEKVRRSRLGELRTEIAIGVAEAERGEVVPLDIEEVIRMARDKRRQQSGEGEG